MQKHDLSKLLDEETTYGMEVEFEPRDAAGRALDAPVDGSGPLEWRSDWGYTIDN